MFFLLFGPSHCGLIICVSGKEQSYIICVSGKEQSHIVLYEHIILYFMSTENTVLKLVKL